MRWGLCCPRIFFDTVVIWGVGELRPAALGFIIYHLYVDIIFKMQRNAVEFIGNISKYLIIYR
jgi:hypothetical protein